MPLLRASALSLSALIAAALLTGCVDSRLSSDAPPGEHLVGDWKLDAARSDDLGKAVDQLRAQMAKARHDRGNGGQQPGLGGSPRHRRSGGQGGQPGGQQGGQDEGQPGTDSDSQGVGIGPTPGTSPVDELMSNIPRGDYLRITAGANSFAVISGDSTNEYTPGLESEISAEQGDAQQISGWKGADYVIDTKPEWGAEIVETYTLTKDGRLMMTLKLSGHGTKLTFNRVYDRTTQVAPLAPPTNN